MTRPDTTPETGTVPSLPGMTHPDVRPISFTASDEALALQEARRRLSAR